MTAILPRCEVCLQFLEFHTDWIGQVVWKHPPYRCVPPPPVVYEAEDEECSTLVLSCDECGKKFSPRMKAKGSQIVCSSECRMARRDRKKRESEQRRGSHWKLSVLKDLALPTRECVECHSLYTITSKYSKKQLVCSLKCRKAREAKKSKERAA